jgi:hypothetical protein
MNKQEVVWLIIRLIGLYLLYCAVTASINFLGTFMTAIQTPSLLEKSLGLFAQAIFLIAIQGIVGIYLLRDGGILFDILQSEGDRNSSGK